MWILERRHLTALISRGVYTTDEVAALEDETLECSWMADRKRVAGPLPIVAVVCGQVVGGVYLLQNQRDGYWFMDNLIRDPADKYRGVGRDVVDAAVIWWHAHGSKGYELRVHSMVREPEAVAWWTRYIGRPPDFRDAFMRARSLVFPAVGWVIAPRWPAN
jgi:hypothetical protein